MGLSYLKNTIRRYLQSSAFASNPKRLCRSTTLSSPTPKPTNHFPKFTSFTYSSSDSNQLRSPQKASISFGVNRPRLFCSDNFRPDEPLYSSNADSEPNSDAERVYKTITDNYHPHSNLEGALEALGVGLTTDLVAEVLHMLRYEEKLAFRFFTWVGRQKNYSHEPRVYTDMIEILSSTKYKIKQFRIVCEMLDYMKRNNKTSVPVEVLLTILRKYCEKYLTHVQKFAKKKRIRVKTQPEINAFNLLLDSLCKCGLVEDAHRMFDRTRRTVKPDATTFNVLFFGWCRVRDPARAMTVLTEMIESGLDPDNFTYIAAIDSFCSSGLVSEAVELFEFMRTSGSAVSSPIAKTYAMIITALVRSDRTNEALKYMGLMMSTGCVPGVSTFKELIEGLCSAGKVEMAYKFLEEMGSRGYPPDIVTYNCFLKVLCDNKLRDEAFRLFGVMVEKGCKPSVQTYNMLILMAFEMGDPDGAIGTWDEIYKSDCAHDTDSYCTMIEGFFRCGRGEDACGLLEEVVRRGMKLPFKKFDSFLAELSRIGNLRAIHRISDHMRTFYCPTMAKRFACAEKQRSSAARWRSKKNIND